MNVTGYYPNTSLGMWVDPSKSPYPDLLEAYLLPQIGPKTEVIWYQPTLIDDDWRNTDDGKLDLVVAKIRGSIETMRRVTDVPIVASRCSFYVPNERWPCKSVENHFSEMVQKALDVLIKEGSVRPGPRPANLPDSLKENRCHPSTEGEQVLGQPLLDFFGP